MPTFHWVAHLIKPLGKDRVGFSQNFVHGAGDFLAVMQAEAAAGPILESKLKAHIFSD